MSLAQLLQVKLPEPSAPLPVEQKASGKPSEDFLAVLDRALNDNYSKPVSQDTAVRDQTELPRNDSAQIDAARSDTAKNDSARFDSLRADSARNDAARTDTTSQPKEKISEKQNEARVSSAHVVSTLAKNREHAPVTEKAHTLQKETFKPQRAETPRSDNVTFANFHQTGAGEVQRQSDARLAHTISKITELPKIAVDTSENQKTRKVSVKTVQTTPVDDRNSPKPGVKQSQAKVATATDPRLESAAARMQLHADTGSSNPKSLQGALDVVKDIARTLGLDSSSDPAKLVGKTIELSRNFVASSTANKAATTKMDSADSAHQKKTEETVSLRQTDRFGRKDAQGALAQAKDAGRVQVMDMRNGAFKSSPVLENLLAAQNGLSSGDSRSKDASRRDSFTILNSSYLPASPITNSVTIPMHLVANQNTNLQQSIRNHLIEKGNNDIIQQARIVMKGQDSGEIRLILKPEALGEVRIHLHMNDGHIAGKIYVENKEVQAAFQDNMDALMQAFQDGGLTTGSMQVAVDGKGSGQSGFNFQERENDEQQKRYAVGKLENSVASVSANDHEYSQINLVV